MKRHYTYTHRIYKHQKCSISGKNLERQTYYFIRDNPVTIWKCCGTKSNYHPSHLIINIPLEPLEISQYKQELELKYTNIFAKIDNSKISIPYIHYYKYCDILREIKKNINQLNNDQKIYIDNITSIDNKLQQLESDFNKINPEYTDNFIIKFIKKIICIF